MTWTSSLFRRRERLPPFRRRWGEGLVDLAARRGLGALVEVAELLRVELEEIEPVEVQPLVDEAAHKFIGLGAGDEAVDFAASVPGS